MAMRINPHISALYTTPPPPPPSNPITTTTPITFILTVVLLIFFGIGFLSIYLCRCYMEDVFLSWHVTPTPSSTIVGSRSNDVGNDQPVKTGLDPSLIEAFPTFPYASIKEFRMDKKYALECAICLLEFEDDNLLRFLTLCCHVFHQECIDLWLESHATCPVCRQDLDSIENLIKESQELVDDDHNNDFDSPLETFEDAIRIDIRDGEESGSNSNMGDAEEIKGSDDKVESKFSRSQSTGHSIVRNREIEKEEEDRYTLRLPEHVIVRGHNWTNSCITFGELSNHPSNSTTSGGFGELS